VRRSLTQLNMVRAVEFSDGGLKVNLASTALDPATQDWVREKAEGAINRLPEVNQVAIEFVEAKPQELNQIGHIIAVMSGKGGVGKSLVAGLLAIGLSRQGYEVGIMDADITGPSIPKMFGVTSRPSGSDSGIMPVISKSGIEIMSINLLLPHEDDAVIWRGPLIGKAIQQFWNDVVWGKLDHLLVDLPPGTADAPLTVMQTLPLSGVVIAFTPQELTAMVVRKAMQMAQKMNIPILGVVENMSYFLIPESGKRIEIFGQSKGEEMAMVAGAPLLGQLPLDPELARLCDEGEIERHNSDAFIALSMAFSQALSERS
jgi:Mrp family chromosome partitioning ATPase